MLNLPPNFTPNDPAFSIGLAALVLIVAAIISYLFIDKKAKGTDQEAGPLTQAEQKSYGIIDDAIKTSRSIIGTTELESVKMAADTRFAVRKFEEEYASELNKLKADLEKKVSDEATEAENNFVKYLNFLGSRIEQAQNMSLELTKKRTGDVFDKFEQDLSSFLTQTEEKSVSAIDLEMRAARALIDKYKAQQFALIDENIIAMLERTLSLVLAKKLSLKDQLDLVYEALEKAKAEKFIA